MYVLSGTILYNKTLPGTAGFFLVLSKQSITTTYTYV